MCSHGSVEGTESSTHKQHTLSLLELLTTRLFTTQVAQQLLADFPELEHVAASAEGDVNLPEQVSSWASLVSEFGLFTYLPSG
jgi:hypothetical protein